MSASRTLVAVVIALAPGCGASDAGSNVDECAVSIGYSPTSPFLGDEVRISASVSVGGTSIPSYDWQLIKAGTDVPFGEANTAGSEIKFTPAEVGVYTARVVVSVAGFQCPAPQEMINVTDGGGLNLETRLHVTPPPGLAIPPIDRALLIPAGADRALGSIVLDPGRPTSGTVKDATGVGIPAYLTFRPLGAEDAMVEMYASASGTYAGQVLNQSHTILVLPADPALPPHQFFAPTLTTSTALSLTPGLPISGVVRGPSNAGLGGAKVTIIIDGVPSTTGVSSATGQFSVLAQATSGAAIQIVVAPPPGSGLPRLEAEGAFSLANGVSIVYAPALATRDVAGTRVVRGAALPGAKVTFVGTLPMAGAITAGITTPAFGYVRIAATANASGDLPSTLVPAAALQAVVAASADDYAVADFVTTTGVPATITAPAMTDEVIAITRGTPLPGAQVQLLPAGALALAGVPTTIAVADATGTIHAPFAAGGVYTAAFSDPTLHAGSKRLVDVTSLPASLELPPAIRISGTIDVQAGAAMVGAAVELRCMACTGLDRVRPLAETVTNAQGAFTLAVTDPGIL